MASRIAKTPIKIPSGVQVTVDGQHLTVKGPKGTLTRSINDAVSLQVAGDLVSLKPSDVVDWAQAGTAMRTCELMMTGVSKGYVVELELHGVGYKVRVEGPQKIVLNLGFSHEVVCVLPAGVTAVAPPQTLLHLQGIDKALVTSEASKIRAIRPPENYKGKGIKRVGANAEVVRLKEIKKK